MRQESNSRQIVGQASAGNPGEAKTPSTRDELSPEQQVALSCIWQGATLARTARAAKVSRSTLHRWRTIDVPFRRQCAAMKKQVFESARQRVALLADDAADAVTNAIIDGNPQVALALLRGLGLLRPAKADSEPRAVNVTGGTEAGPGRESQVTNVTLSVSNQMAVNLPQDASEPPTMQTRSQVAGEISHPAQTADAPASSAIEAAEVVGETAQNKPAEEEDFPNPQFTLALARNEPTVKRYRGLSSNEILLAQIKMMPESNRSAYYPDHVKRLEKDIADEWAIEKRLLIWRQDRRATSSAGDEPPSLSDKDETNAIDVPTAAGKSWEKVPEEDLPLLDQMAPAAPAQIETSAPALRASTPATGAAETQSPGQFSESADTNRSVDSDLARLETLMRVSTDDRNGDWVDALIAVRIRLDDQDEATRERALEIYSRAEEL